MPLHPSGQLVRALSFPGAISFLFLAGCDFFATRDFLHKPGEIRALGLSRPGDSLVFRAVESLRDPGGSRERAVLARKRLRFAYLGDSLRGADTLKAVSLRVTDEATGEVLEEGLRLLGFTAEGITLEGPEAGGGPRFFPLKAAAGPGVPEAGPGVPEAGPGADTGVFLAVPAVFLPGWSWLQSLGDFEVSRRVAATDTLSYRGRLEEAWVLDETVRHGDAVLARGNYWYGTSGLLRAVQTWEDFDWRDGASASPGAPVHLRRQIDRL